MDGKVLTRDPSSFIVKYICTEQETIDKNVNKELRDTLYCSIRAA